MTSRVRFTEAAEVDLDEATAWYAEQQPSMSLAFLEAVSEIVDRIARNPLAFPQAVDDVRRANLKRFPYALWFLVEPDESIVIAALHHRQDRRELQGRKPRS